MRNRFLKWLPLIPLILVVAVTSVEAPFFPILGDLKSAKSLKCTFTKTTIVKPDKPWPTPVIGEDRMEAHYDSIDHIKKRARLIGNLGAGDVSVGSNDAGIYFIEVAPGNVSLTFVFAGAQEGARKFRAAESRNLAVLGKIAPSQTYGYCEVWE